MFTQIAQKAVKAVKAVKLVESSKVVQADPFMSRLSEQLENQARSLHSSVLASLSSEVSTSSSMKKDHFKKIRGMIRDMIARLKEEAKNFQDAEDYCVALGGHLASSLSQSI